MATDQNCFVMILRSRVLKVFLILGLSFMFTAVYVNFFQHPPADMLLAMNSRGAGGAGGYGGAAPRFGPPRTVVGRSAKGKFSAYGEEEEGGEEEEEEVRRPKDSYRNGIRSSSRKSKGVLARNDDDFDDEEDNNNNKNNNKINDDEDTIAKRSEENSITSSTVKYEDFWNKFLQRNNFVTIGAVYDRCENWRVQYGTVVMLPDKENGGVTSRTFVNITLEHEIDGGQFNIEVKYNGKDLYDNYWEICELDEELPPQNRTFNCPVAAGHHNKVKDRHIPNYLPKGRYQTKAWASDEDEKVFVCGYSDFTI